ncbi:MAG: Glyceraldehyde-3-phosphate dehydrogenase [bacterium ADurb.Bin212]|nr:MAG: Glyceraldehyde-3-phosphate dehydrogenase [bacterium ADurb.Bin212]
MINVAINGFGRIGRAAAKIVLDNPNMKLVAINDLGDVETLAHLLKYDSCYGIFQKEVGWADNELIVNTQRIHFYSEKDPSLLPWRELDIDVVIESTGIFLTYEKAKPHIDAGAKRVVLSAPPKDDSVPTYLIGVNAKKYAGEPIVSNASCTTNCIGPIMHVLEQKFGIEKSLMTTIHSYTADQNLVDGPHKDLRRARAAAVNIVPTSTGAAKALGVVMPKVQGKFDGLAVRVPTPVVSLSDITVLLKTKTSIEEINAAFEEAAEREMRGIIVASEQPIVSSDLVASSASTTVDLPLTNVMGGDLAKVIGWYDNEWGYSCRLVELSELVATK